VYFLFDKEIPEQNDVLVRGFLCLNVIGVLCSRKEILLFGFVFSEACVFVFDL